MTVDDHDGACHQFTTPDIPEYFTERFSSSDNDLENFSILWTPNGSVDYYGMCGYEIAELPTDPAGGEVLELRQSSFERITLASWALIPFYGVDYDTFYVSGNGTITFTAGDTSFNPTLEQHFALPRISGLFTHLNPLIGGVVSWKQLHDRAVITFANVPEQSAIDESNTFQVEMFFDGRIRVSYLEIDADRRHRAGLSDGNGRT